MQHYKTYTFKYNDDAIICIMVNVILDWITEVINYIKKEYRIRDDCYTSYKDLKYTVSKQFPKANVYISDDRMTFIYMKDMIKTAARLNFLRVKEYKKTKRDCEDYAFSFKGDMSKLYGGFAFGIVFVDTLKGKHALNCFINEFGKFYYLEPQNNNITLAKDIKDHYTPYLIII